MILPSNVSIRPATLDDLDAIVALWSAMMAEHEAFDPRIRLAPNADNAYRQYAHQHIANEAAVYVAECQGAVVAFLLAYPARNLPMYLPHRYGYLSDLTVAKEWRGRGIGAALVEAAREWFRENGVAHVQLQVYDQNASGMDFWRKEGCAGFVNGLWMRLEP